MPGNSLLL